MIRRVCAILAVLVGTTPAVANVPDTVAYRVKENDSYALIAAEFYGDRTKARFVMAENKVQQPRPLARGQLLRVPAIRELVTAPGDTFQSLAETLLGDAQRGGFLAEANGMSPDDNLAAGVSLLIPFTVTHVAQATETLEVVANTYYGERKYADVLRRYNNLDKRTLDKAEAITIPSYRIRMHPSRILPPADPEAKARREKRQVQVKLAATALPVARHAWRVGNYDTVRRALEPIDTAFVDLEPAIEIGVLLGSAYVAFGNTARALEEFRRVLDRKPSHALRKVDHSPKVLALWKQSDGPIE
jgi:LysM repeat protein